MKRILVIGDSYGAAGRHENFFMPEFSSPTVSTFWGDLLQDHYSCNMTTCAYGGKSWWFSFQMFEQWRRLNRAQWRETDLVIFLHTDHGRFNSSNHLVPGNSTMGIFGCKPEEEKQAKQIRESLKYYELDLYDNTFNHWCQNRFFSTLADAFVGKRIIHIACFEETIKSTNYSFITPGAVVMLALNTISFGECKQDPRIHGLRDTRTAHLSEENHHVLTQHLIKIIDDYRDGPIDIPLSSFRQGFYDNHR